MTTLAVPAHTPRLERLRACWHGVAYAAAVGRAPHRTLLLGEPIVVWRDSRQMNVNVTIAGLNTGSFACAGPPSQSRVTMNAARRRFELIGRHQVLLGSALTHGLSVRRSRLVARAPPAYVDAEQPRLPLI